MAVIDGQGNRVSKTMFELWMIRHGTSTANVSGHVTGSADARLTQEGKQQANLLGDWLRGHWQLAPDLYLTSDMQRAVETSSLLGLSMSARRLADLNETDAGDVAEWTRTKFDANYTDFWDPFDPARAFPGGESHQDLYDRVTSCMSRIVHDAPDNAKILLVAHAGTISSIFHHAYDVPMSLFSRFVVANGSLSVLRYADMLTPPELLVYSQLPPADAAADVSPSA